MTSQIEIDEINKRLINKYGNDLTGRARFRLIWNTKEYTETRKGTFRDHDSNNIFIREVTEVRTVPKYEIWLDYFILEILNEFSATPDDVYNYNRYEMLYVFKKKDGTAQDEMAWLPVQFLIESLLAGKDIAKRQNTMKYHAEEYIKAGEREKKLFFEILDNENPYIPGLLADKGGSAVVNPGTESLIKIEEK